MISKSFISKSFQPFLKAARITFCSLPLTHLRIHSINLLDSVKCSSFAKVLKKYETIEADKVWRWPSHTIFSYSESNFQLLISSRDILSDWVHKCYGDIEKEASKMNLSAFTADHIDLVESEWFWTGWPTGRFSAIGWFWSVVFRWLVFFLFCPVNLSYYLNCFNLEN